MTAEPIVELQQAAPFQPFDIHLADGRLFRLQHPDFLTVSPGRRSITIYALPDSAEVIDLLQIISLHYRETEIGIE